MRTPIPGVGCVLVAVAVLGVSLSFPACAPAQDATSDAGRPDVFVAFTDDFAGFHRWKSYPVEHDADAGPVSDDAGVHLQNDPMVEYIKHPPPSGLHKFPIGTIIVKEVSTGALVDRKVFAMVKRGGDFDRGGAVDWEWFELNNIDQASARIVWRGVGPKMGEKYGGDPRICNECHLSSENDAVLSNALQLENF